MRSEARLLPELFLSRLRKIIPSQKFDAVANSFTDTKPTTFRINSLKTSRELVHENLGRQGFHLAPISWYPDAFVLRGGRLRELEKTESYLKGEIYVQNLSSMIPPLVLDPKPREYILDLTAAPGSKTTQMACLMKGEGTVLANESDRIRYEKLKANVELQGASNVQVLLGYGESMGKKYPERFDKVLLDAPCSAEGRFNAREPSSYRYWAMDKVKEIAKLQKKLFLSAVSALKPGGILVYSTCTFAPEENEEVVNEALEKFSGQIEIETINFSIPNKMMGLLAWEGEKFSPSIKKAIRILPTSEMEGFFVVCLRKKSNRIKS